MSAPIKAQTEEATVIETIAVLGAGRVGSAIARTALAAGFRVNIASSGPAADIEMLVDVVVPGANAMAAAEAVADADLVILAIPLHKDRKSTRLNSSHVGDDPMPSSAG